MSHPETADSVTAAEFFAAVDRLVTAPMADLGYSKIGDFDQVSRGMHAQPLRAGSSPLRRRLVRALRDGSAGERELSVGYEGFKDGHDDEKWVHFHPDRAALVMSDWRETLGSRGQWGVVNDVRVFSKGDLQRRLELLGGAITAQADACDRPRKDGAWIQRAISEGGPTIAPARVASPR